MIWEMHSEKNVFSAFVDYLEVALQKQNAHIDNLDIQTLLVYVLQIPEK